MFDNEDEYMKATKHAQVHIIDENRGISFKLIFINMVLLLALLGLGFFYFQKDLNLSSTDSIQKVAVLGVSHTSSKTEFSDNDLIGMLDDVEVDNVVERATPTNNVNIYDAMSQLVDESSSMKSSSTYSEAISKELDDKKTGFKGKVVVVVKKGDTLSTLAEEYYGDAKAYRKILEDNKNISKQSKRLYVGQKITIMY